MNKYCLIIISVLIIFSCKNETAPIKTSIDEIEILEDIPADFVEFYNRFHSDSTFQINHIRFPLAVKDDGSKWQKNNWKVHKAFNSQNDSYTRSFSNFSGLIFEYIEEKTGAFKIEKRYSKSKDSYDLIYYKSQVQMKGWEPE